MIARILFVICVICSPFGNASERILEFNSDIQILKDGGIQVHETIKVLAENDQIRHGILREFPTQYQDRLGNSYDVRFTLLETRLDGRPVKVHQTRQANGIVLRIGDADSYVPRGEHTYEIIYYTVGQIGFFENFDELYWNVTGNGWRFAIDSAKATIRLPAEVSEGSIKKDGYTGYLGGKGKDFSSAFVKTSTGEIAAVSFMTTRPLQITEGLTVAVSWPKGLVDAPSFMGKATWFIKDNLGIGAMIVGFAFFLVIFVRTRRRIRASNEPGTIIPLFDPPVGMLPSQVRYLANKGYDAQVLACEIVNLAVLGYLTISFESGLYSVLRTEKSPPPVNDLHRTIWDALFAGGKRVHQFGRSDKEMIALVKKVKGTLKDWMGTVPHFATDYRAFLSGLAVNIVTVIVAVVLQRDMGAAFFIGAAIILVMTVIFAMRLTAYSKSGRKLMDQVDGFKLFLATTETERLKVIGTPPTRTPELYEKFLPFAIALNVEEQWSKQFTPVFEVLERENRAYVPVWYVGALGTSFRANKFSTSMVSSLNTAISSSSSSPGSSSGSSGGGSSGGGVGGGGGGGW